MIRRSKVTPVTNKKKKSVFKEWTILVVKKRRMKVAVKRSHNRINLLRKMSRVSLLRVLGQVCHLRTIRDKIRKTSLQYKDLKI